MRKNWRLPLPTKSLHGERGTDECQNLQNVNTNLRNERYWRSWPTLLCSNIYLQEMPHCHHVLTRTKALFEIQIFLFVYPLVMTLEIDYKWFLSWGKKKRAPSNHVHSYGLFMGNLWDANSITTWILSWLITKKNLVLCYVHFSKLTIWISLSTWLRWKFH